MSIRVVAGRDGRGPGRPNRITLSQTARNHGAKVALRRVRFASGRRVGQIELSPRLRIEQCRQLEFWIRRLPLAFLMRMPHLKLAIAERLSLVRGTVRINETVVAAKATPGTHTHAVSYIVEQYVILEESLFSSRVELGRILYHELCHFLWPRLGNPKRQEFAALLEREFHRGTRGELGYSSEWRKQKMGTTDGVQLQEVRSQLLWRDYVCESFCDTGSFVLLGSERRATHSEYTLSSAARKRRVRLWARLVLGDSFGSGKTFSKNGDLSPRRLARNRVRH
ncbi:MAG: hypothetical protein HY647_12220 [Acidobacteria bacterium]|nr:hypothetical protein [Acidobacteriota bacterium]